MEVVRDTIVPATKDGPTNFVFKQILRAAIIHKNHHV